MSSSIGQWFKNLSEEEIRKVNEIERKKAEEDYKKFKEAFSRGMCSLCGSPLSTISREKPCLHWLLRQCKFKKKDFKLLYPTISYFQMNAYLRWVANQDVYMKNINDLTDEKNPSKIIETTIKYKHIEWSFSCSQSDFEGHKGSKADFPHYHFQMRIDGRPFIDYTDYHIPFLESDIFNFVLIKNHGAIESYGLGGVGMQSGISLEPEDIINYSHACDDEEKAVYHILTMAEFENGISGEELNEVFEISKRTGKTITRILHERGTKMTSIITPHKSVPEIAKRTERKK
ncbi:MAG: hypothetical protein PWQ59_1479 [Thermoanaerobacterium sp.]|nr:hypothetical protein [Thermoanaerobacterium sp.]MDK2905066.1 hypothetical protein [Eubacteriaceae bacterium]